MLKSCVCQSRLTHGLKRGSAGSNPPESRKFVSDECCVLSGRGLCDELGSLVQRSPTECGVSECDREVLTMRRPWPSEGCCAKVGRKALYLIMGLPKD